MILPSSYSLPFIKMQALGNDFIFIDGEKLLDSASRPLLSQWTAVAPQLARQLCQRHHSIGADGLILALPLNNEELRQMAINLYGQSAQDCQLSWTYHNSDGSQSDICGNGLRCLSLWSKLEKDMPGLLKVATAAGPLVISYKDEQNITASLGAPKLKKAQIPFSGAGGQEQTTVQVEFMLDNLSFPITCVNVGNPHCVIFTGHFLQSNLFKDLDGQENHLRPTGQLNSFFPQELMPIAAAIEIDSSFPEKTNVEFVHVLNRAHIQVLVWERGCGPTLACGSGAAAAAVAGVLENRLDRLVKVSLPGGTLLIDWSNDNELKMTGSASLSYHGQIELNVEQLRANAQNSPRPHKSKVKTS